jgi:AcrR family transcriptional regulator
MYRRLPHGPHGMRREEVARHQRTRLYGAMTEAVYKWGYPATTVAHVIALAGVSRRAFYEQFANKEECFLATFDISVARAKKRMLDAWLTDRGWANRLHRSCQAFVEDATENAKSARLVLVDALGIGPHARERQLLATSAFERVVAGGFGVAPDGIRLPPLAPRAIVGGGRYVIFARLRDGRAPELAGLTDELLDWVSAYRSSAAARLATSGSPNPPHVPVAPARFLSGDDKRSRTLGAVVHLTFDEGFRELTDPQIAQFAGMSTEAFHKQFPTKEQCFLAAFDEFAEEVLETMIAATEPASSWPEAVYLAIRGAVEYMVAHPGLVRMAFIDIYDVGPMMVDRLAAALERFAKLLAENSPEPRRAPLLCAEAVTGAVWAVMGSYAVRNRLRYLPCLIDHLSFLVLAPYLGPKPAIEAIDSARRLTAKSAVALVRV